MFTGWINHYLRPQAAAGKVVHPSMLRAIAVAKKKNDRIEADKVADCLRCDFLPVRLKQNAKSKYTRRSRKFGLNWFR